MGLDLVELVMTVEQTFGITIDDRDAEQIRTIGQLHYYVLSKLGAKAESSCPSASAFYQVRRVLIERWQVARREVRPGTRLEALMPTSPRIESWAGFGEATGLKLPRLLLPRWCVMTANWLYLASVAAMLVAGFRIVGFQEGMIVLVGLASFGLLIGVLNLSERLQGSFGSRIPANFATVGNVARILAATQYSNTDPDLGNQDAWEILLAIVAELSGVSRDRLHADLSFVDDLGLD